MMLRYLSMFCVATAVLWGGGGTSQAQEGNVTGQLKVSAAAPLWWKRAVFYEVYPRSYGDTNGDGIGDLNGITAPLAYLQKIGVGAIWIAPFYPSPQVDFGYDISNYTDVDPQFGTLADFDRLIREAKMRGIRVVVDMVLNHTSNQHKWFVESARSRQNSKADWYIWNDGLPTNAPGLTAYQKRYVHDGRVPPNNWISMFGGSAWEWSPVRKQFYYHRFYKEQPDLNWRNPDVEAAMFQAMRFWLDRGVSGFRLDAISMIYEDQRLRNAAELGGVDALGDPKLDRSDVDNLPEVHALVRRIRAMLDTYPGHLVLLGETATANIADLDRWYGGAAQDELQLPINFMIGFKGPNTFSADHFRSTISEAETGTHGGQPLIYFDNHDIDRSIDRFGDGVHNLAIAKAAAAVLFTVRGTPLTYYGAPLGMTTQTPLRKEDVRDPWGIAGWPRQKGRDGERTPMQWTPGPQAGFSTNPKTWLPVAPNYKTVNVETETADPDSLLNWYKQLISLRASTPALLDGSMTMLNPEDHNVFAYLRTAPGNSERVIIAVNMSASPQTVSFAANEELSSTRAVRTLAASDPALRSIRSIEKIPLPPFTAWIGAIR